MRAHDKYYGHALREAESGKRRDDLWGRAFAQAKGDQQAASGIYIDLLAKRLEQLAGAPERVAQVEEAKHIAGAFGSMALEGAGKVLDFAVRWAIRFGVSLAVAIGLTYVGTSVYSNVKETELTDKWVPAHEKELAEGVENFRSFQLSRGHIYSEEEIRKDFSSLDYLSLGMKYGFDGSSTLRDEFLYSPYEQARRIAKVSDDTSFSIGFVIFLVLFCGCIVLAWREHFYGSKEQPAGPLPHVKT
jgi:hypothetical protein